LVSNNITGREGAKEKQTEHTKVENGKGARNLHSKVRPFEKLETSLLQNVG